MRTPATSPSDRTLPADEGRGTLGQAVDRIGGQPISAHGAQGPDSPPRSDAALGNAGPLRVRRGDDLFGDGQQAGGRRPRPGMFLKRQMSTSWSEWWLLIVSSFDYRQVHIAIYGMTVVRVLVVLTPARTWAGLQPVDQPGSFQVQPSELAKIAVIIVLAAYLASRKDDIRVGTRGRGGCRGVPSALIFVEPDLGTMMVLRGLFGGVLLIGGERRLRHSLRPAGWRCDRDRDGAATGLLQDYQIERITAFLDANPDVQSEGFQLTQSKIAIGSGGLEGKGFKQEHTQTAPRLHPRAAHGLHLHGGGRAAGLHGLGDPACLVRIPNMACFTYRRDSRDLFGTLARRRDSRYVGIPVIRERGDDDGDHAADRHHVALHLLRRFELLINFIAAGLLLNVHMRRYLV